jgi:hypothetical protein
MLQTFSTQKKSISPTVIMVPHASNENIIPLSFPNGVKINALKVNHFSHQCERQIQLNFRGPFNAYLVTTDINNIHCNIYYLVTWNEEDQRHYCSCYAHRRDGHCHHIDAVIAFDVETKPVIEEATKDEVPAKETIKDKMQAARNEAIKASPSYDELQELKQRDINAYWREIAKRGRRINKAERDVYWREVKALRLTAQTSSIA